MATFRTPPAPRTSGFRNPLRLAPVRAPGSIDLDNEQADDGTPLPPYQRFDRFLAEFTWRQGEHVTVIGPTGSGKTVLARQLLRRRDFVVVLGVKNRDPELYEPFQREGYVVTDTFDPEPEDGETHLIFRPRLTAPTAEARNAQRNAFSEALTEIFLAGRWCVYADDIQYMTSNLRLSTEFENLWILGRSEQISVYASSQEPVDIPVMAYGFATHLFLFRNPDLYRARRMAELTGTSRAVVQRTILRLPKYEFLYVNKDTGHMVRSKVIREREPR